MTVYTVYAATTDAQITSGPDSTYATARAGTALTRSPSSSTWAVGQAYLAPNYTIYQGFASFNTSTIPTGVTNSVSLGFDLNSASPSSDVTIDAAESAWSGSTADFVAGADLAALTDFGSITLNADTGAQSMSGPADVARTADYKLILFGKDQADNVAPTGFEAVIIKAAETSGTASDPRLTVDVSLTLSMTADTAAFTLTGQDATLRKSVPYDLPADAGAFTMTGQDAELTYAQGIAAQTGTFTLTGQDATFTAIRSFPAAVGAFTLTGVDAAMTVARSMAAAVGEFILTGIDIILRRLSLPPAGRRVVFAAERLADRTVSFATERLEGRTFILSE